MNIPSKRSIGVIALLIAAIAAVGTPLFLLHSGSPQGTSPTTSGNNNGNNNNGQSTTKTPTTTTTTTTTNSNNGSNGSGSGSNGGSSGGNGDNSGTGSSSSSSSGSTGSCNTNKSHDPKHDNDSQAKGNDDHGGNAYGAIKNRLDTTVALVKAIGVQDSAYHMHHDTKTDNDTVHGHRTGSQDAEDRGSSCASSDQDHDEYQD